MKCSISGGLPVNKTASAPRIALNAAAKQQDIRDNSPDQA